MLHFKLNSDGKVTDVSEKYPTDERGQWIARHEMKVMADAERIAKEATEVTGRLHIASDRGTSTWPRFDVVEAPKVGDAVSYSFNGDSYPDGEITHITKGTLRIIKTSTGSTYYRHKQRASWVKDGTWSLIPGHVNERNPHF